MNIKTFKKLCLKASTKKADTIHEYYINMEKAMHEYIVIQMQKQQQEQKEKLLLECYRNKKVMYFGTVVYTDLETGERYVIGKFGCTKDIWVRLGDHKRDFGSQFELQFVVECEEHEDLEKKFKQDSTVKQHRIKRTINGQNMTELVLLDDTFNIDTIRELIEKLKKAVMQSKQLLEMKHNETMKQLELELFRALRFLNGTKNTNKNHSLRHA